MTTCGRRPGRAQSTCSCCPGAASGGMLAGLLAPALSRCVAPACGRCTAHDTWRLPCSLPPSRSNCSRRWRPWGCRRGCRQPLRCGRLLSPTFGEHQLCFGKYAPSLLPVNMAGCVWGCWHCCLPPPRGLLWGPSCCERHHCFTPAPCCERHRCLPAAPQPACPFPRSPLQAARDPSFGAWPRRHLWRRHRQPLLHHRHGGGAARGGDQR